ncbi:MAG: hypothetical protein HKP09_09525, partial [Enterobacterales bacterium]|nr:hypothetical protein [Enterobacterales bacterium]
ILQSDDEHLSMFIENPYQENQDPESKGNQVAVENIKKRLELLYGDASALHMHQKPNAYQVEVKLPKQLTNENISR